MIKDWTCLHFNIYIHNWCIIMLSRLVVCQLTCYMKLHKLTTVACHYLLQNIQVSELSVQLITCKWQWHETYSYLNTATVNYLTYCSIQKPSSSTRQGWNRQRKLWPRGQPRQENTGRPLHINRYIYDWLTDKYWQTTSYKQVHIRLSGWHVLIRCYI